MGLFKKKATPGEFGHAVLHLAMDWLAADAGRSLGRRFENADGSNGWGRFLEGQGISVPVQKLHYRIFAHCALQAASTQFGEETGAAMTQGAMAGFKSPIDGYDFESTRSALDAAYRGEYAFNPRLEPLSNADFQIAFLPNPNVRVLNAKYLIESFVIPNMPKTESFIGGFQGYSGDVCATLGTVQRAIEQLSRSFKIS